MNHRDWSSRSRWSGVALSLTVLLAACGGGDPADDSPDAAEGTADVEQGGSGEFDSELVAAAQEEGEVTVYSGAHTREHADLAAQLFEEEFGITVTISRQPSGAVRQQVEAELAADALGADVLGLNDATTLQSWEEEGIITDAGVPNRDQFLDAVDPGDTAHIPYTFTPLGVIFNTLEVEEADIPSTWAELPSMDATFVHSDPRSSGVALGYTWAMVDLVGEDFYTQLAEREVLTSESGTAVGQMVATGEVLVAIPGPEVLLGPLLEEGEPVAIKYMDDGIPAIPSYLAQVADSPHPNAGQLFVQWHAGSSFQQALIDVGGRSVLQDATPPENVPDLDVDNLIVPPASEVNDQREELGQVFEQVLD